MPHDFAGKSYAPCSEKSGEAVFCRTLRCASSREPVSILDSMGRSPTCAAAADSEDSEFFQTHNALHLMLLLMLLHLLQCESAVVGRRRPAT